MCSTGFIKLHRELLESPIWKCSNSIQKEILITLLLMVNYKPNKWFFNGEEFELKAGELLTSLPSIKENCSADVSIQNIRTALNRFEKLNFLTVKSTNKYRIISILNWETYQSNKNETNRQTNRQLTGSQQATNRQLTAIKESKKGRREECKNEYMNIGNTNILAQSDFLQNPSEPKCELIEPEIDYDFYVDSTQGPIGITAEHLEKLKTSFPGVDQRIAFNDIKLWTDANPRRRKTPRGIQNFVNNWFRRAQNQGANNGNNAIRQAGYISAKQTNGRLTIAEVAKSLEAIDCEKEFDWISNSSD